MEFFLWGGLAFAQTPTPPPGTTQDSSSLTPEQKAAAAKAKADAAAKADAKAPQPAPPRRPPQHRMDVPPPVIVGMEAPPQDGLSKRCVVPATPVVTCSYKTTHELDAPCQCKVGTAMQDGTFK